MLIAVVYFSIPAKAQKGMIAETKALHHGENSIQALASCFQTQFGCYQDSLEVFELGVGAVLHYIVFIYKISLDLILGGNLGVILGVILGVDLVVLFGVLVLVIAGFDSVICNDFIN